jgi:hypothetical protein
MSTARGRICTQRGRRDAAAPMRDRAHSPLRACRHSGIDSLQVADARCAVCSAYGCGAHPLLAPSARSSSARQCTAPIPRHSPSSRGATPRRREAPTNRVASRGARVSQHIHTMHGSAPHSTAKRAAAAFLEPIHAVACVRNADGSVLSTHPRRTAFITDGDCAGLPKRPTAEHRQRAGQRTEPREGERNTNSYVRCIYV